MEPVVRKRLRKKLKQKKVKADRKLFKIRKALAIAELVLNTY